MLDLESKFFNEYYSSNPDFYTAAFMHYNIEIFNYDNNEYEKLERDFNKIKDYTKELFKIYFSDINTLIDIKNNSNIVGSFFKDIYLRINSVKDIDNLNQELNNLKIIISYNDLENYKDLDINKYSIVLQIDAVRELSKEDLLILKKKYNIKEIIVGQICYLDSYFIDFFKRIGNKFNIDYKDQLSIEKQALISNDNYSTNLYIDIYERLLKLVEGIDIREDDINKFNTIYERIINNITYSTSEKIELVNQNLIGGLFLNNCVCEGFSKILQQALSLVNIESIVVGGGGKREEDGHIWNQVKIDNKWYNADASYDSIQTHQNKPIKLKLVKDDILYYKTNYLIANKCNSNYER